ncbi:enhanced serine sensitivity protein SseB C-terminal domain-containing protein [Lacticaseibacillus suibinensis]|uniref:enhanced serine sensitivity protein SseB C-terminal domain-containing protein n=1 Tax=Lacticaseibacillus suibinensis TaxID=2486011 RepID=UPI000F7B075E|nr:enhanced serine sensitivity protein SseB C-terminal domain-containing protein [Lacticaseibacillus suibinensis]
MTENEHNLAVQGVTNDGLLAKWNSYRLEDNDENMSAFLEELIEHATLLMVVLADQEIKTDEAGKAQMDADVDMKFPLMTTQDNRQIQPLFTDWQEVNMMFDNWHNAGLDENVDRASILPINFYDLSELIKNNDSVNGIAINPFADNIFLDRPMVADLAKQARAHHADKDEVQVAVSDPTDLPKDLWPALKAKLTKAESVKRAWLRLMHYDGTEHLILIVDAPDEDAAAMTALTEALGQTGEKYLADVELGMSAVGYDDDTAPIVAGVDPLFTR